MSVFVQAAKEVMENNQHTAEAMYLLICWDSTLSEQSKLKMAVRCVELEPKSAGVYSLDWKQIQP